METLEGRRRVRIYTAGVSASYFLGVIGTLSFIEDFNSNNAATSTPRDSLKLVPIPHECCTCIQYYNNDCFSYERNGLKINIIKWWWTSPMDR